ncbi:hypothetical protein Rs2_02171 [Raphanus sativus]|nr:hypothetical protein Rs2_02171 [Raphanus sativus]
MRETFLSRLGTSWLFSHNLSSTVFGFRAPSLPPSPLVSFSFVADCCVIWILTMEARLVDFVWFHCLGVFLSKLRLVVYWGWSWITRSSDNAHGTSSFPVSALHRIGILDIRILKNTDRHSGNRNLLVKKLDGVGMFGQVELIPIDHGLCLPENLEDLYFEWIHWPQASIPFSEEEMKYIASRDPFEDCEMLRRERRLVSLF